MLEIVAAAALLAGVVMAVTRTGPAAAPPPLGVSVAVGGPGLEHGSDRSHGFDLSSDLPCPWCRAATTDDDIRCPSCGQRFG